MAGLYQLQPDGSALVETPAGAIRMTMDEARLQELGYAPAPVPPELSMLGPGSGAMAQGGGAGGVGNVPEAADFDRSGQNLAQGGRPAQMLDQDILEGAAGDPTKQKLSPNTEVVNITRETHPQKAGEPTPTGRRGAPTTDIDTGGGGGPDPRDRPRFVKVGGKDIRAGFTKQLGVGREALDEAELALADASIDKKLSAQNIAERDTTRAETASAALGRQIRREEQAVREQEQRDRGMAEDYQKRQAAIDKERAAIENLDIKPDTLFDKEDWAKVIGSIVAIVGSVGHGFSGKGGPTPMDRLVEAQDRSIARQKERREMRRQNLVSRESELERIEKHYGDPRLAEAELRDRQRMLIQQYGQKMLLDAGATDSLDKFKAQLAGWDEERAHGRLEREQKLGDKVVEQWQYIPERSVQVGGQKPLTDEQRKRLVNVNGQRGFVPGESDRRPIQESVSSLEHLGGQLDRLQQIVDQTGVSDVDKQRQIEALVGSLGPSLAVAQGQGAMSDDERKAIANRLGDAQSFLGSKDRAKTLIGETKQFFQAKKDAVVRGSVYSDPDATTPMQGAPSRTRRYE